MNDDTTAPPRSKPESRPPKSTTLRRGSPRAAVVEADLVALGVGERSELVDTLRRVQADFENYRKRVLREQTTLVEQRDTSTSSRTCSRSSTRSRGALAHIRQSVTAEGRRRSSTA